MKKDRLRKRIKQIEKQNITLQAIRARSKGFWEKIWTLAIAATDSSENWKGLL